MPNYGRDFGGSRGGGRYPSGGMRSDGGWRNDWREFPGEEGWYGGSRGYDAGYRDQGYREQGPDSGRGMRAYGGQQFEHEQMGGPGARELGYEMDPSRSRGRGRSRGRQRSNLRAAELMTENPEVVGPDATLGEVAKRMRDMDVGMIPVVDEKDGRRLRGVITDRDIVVRALAEGKNAEAKVSECMTDDVESVNKNDPVDRVFQLMEREQVRRVPVTDREGRLVGIIAQADLAVDYTELAGKGASRVGRTVERISEPGHPRH